MITDWDDAYANGDHIADAGSFPGMWAEQSSRFRDALITDGRAELDVPYGSADREKYDLFLPVGAPKGLVVLVHGGYWKAFDKSSWSHLANGAVARGWAVCLPSYTLAPDARLSRITRQVAAAINHVAGRISGPIHLTGHSAGGHLVSRMVSNTSPLAPGVLARVENTVSISGLHDLRPLLYTSMNDVLGLDEEEAATESAALLKPTLPCSLTCWVGADERPEFVRQNDLLANIWTGLGASTRSVHAPDKHHFDVIADLADPESDLTACLLTPISGEDD
ncbi:alpha/beta hydrolase [Thalassospira povalilytica]|uniref:Alpha/beta hydrolase n=1 Tax=Thalassospira povalilytica TaxID=732237 RepID=A0ABX4R473_9PROT|nr:alpha/beta hydrolase [Thalassospira povalilytica]PKR47768.1 alpha/beta hydrolase [Thalassospira povalilytica]